MAINTRPSFATGGAGMVVTQVGTIPGSGNGPGANGIALQGDRLIVAGESYNGNDFDFSLIRYLPDGTLDTSFGTGGKVITSVGQDDSCSSVFVQSDGKILVTGSDGDDITVVRYLADGSLDTSFGGDGKVTTQVTPYASMANEVIVLADGKVVVCGNAYDGFTSYDFALVRYNADGSLDAGFGAGGKTTTDFDHDNDRATAMAVQNDGKIVVGGHTFVGTSNNDVALARYNADGSLDTTFGVGGKVTSSFGRNESVSEVVVQQDGKILVAGSQHLPSARDMFVARYNADGTLDTDFGTDGFVRTRVGPETSDANSMVLQPDGKILLAGTGFVNINGGSPASYDFVLVRLNADGTLDTTFSGDGQVRTGILGSDRGNDVILQPDGKIVVAGEVDGKFAAVRYNADGTLDTSFGGTNSLDGHPTFTEGGATVVLDSNVTVSDAELSVSGSYSGATLTLLRDGGASADDVFGAAGTLSALIDGGALKVGGTTIGTVTQNSGGELVLTFGAAATQTRVNEALRQITYANTDHTPVASVTIDWAFSDGNKGVQGTGGALTAAGATTVTIIATDGGEAKDDEFATDEATPVSGNVFADNGSGADADLDGFTVTAVNGVAASVGKQVTLASGALLTLNADGTFNYDPNDALDWVPAEDSGAYTLIGSDSFTYELSKGSIATVTITATGFDSDDRLFGLAGIADTFKGGVGDDTYFVYDASDVVVEEPGSGTDRIATSRSFVLPTGLEIEAISTTNASRTTAINLTGNKLAQQITGNAAANTLHDGGAGAADTLRGLRGNDVYLVYNAGDIIVEAAGEGTDRVSTAIDYKLTAGASIEILNTTSKDGISPIDLTGNTLKQTTTGNAGINVLHDGGPGGADTMAGLNGDDTYRVFNSGDVIVETAAQGTDRVMAAVDFQLGGGVHVELLTTNGSAGASGIDLTGNELAQEIYGNSGANLIDGKGGLDTLYGGNGTDTFVFSAAFGVGNVDTMADFSAAADTIALDNAIFTKLTVSGQLLSGYFRANTTGAAQDANDHIIYETDTGRLIYDSNGSAGGGAVIFATLTGNPTITAADFVVI